MNGQSLTRRAALACGLVAAAAIHFPAAADDFPSKPIRWIVPYAPGTAPDQTVRILGDVMTDILKQPIVIENRPGAAGNVGAQIAARAAPDGYTWIYSGSPMATNMRMYREPGFDVMKDFIHVGRIGISDLVIVTRPDTAIRTLSELIAKAKAQPGKLSYATGGVGSPAHLAGAMLLSAAGAQALHVPFKGANESTRAVMGGQVDFALALSTVALPFIKSGQLVPLAVSGDHRVAALPKVPTMREEGIPVSVSSFGGLSVPRGTPAPIVKRIGDALTQAMARPNAQARIEAIGGQFNPETGTEYAQDLRQEIPLTESMMRAANLQAQ
ncbi:MAG: tripartite tricarboxylate transporter substrate binding protein [Burkholderiales bacterium]|nr:tripartite tricarboxylate transporter substrate binding protein [Burkholderiales bacterium]